MKEKLQAYVRDNFFIMVKYTGYFNKTVCSHDHRELLGKHIPPWILDRCYMESSLIQNGEKTNVRIWKIHIEKPDI